MTQKEIEKFLANTKVYVNGKSKEIQEKLFELGYKCTWTKGNTSVVYTEDPFLFIYEEMFFTRSSNMDYFSKHDNKEITADEILSLELTEPSYRPFKNREECWNEMLKHQPFGWLLDKDGNEDTYKLLNYVGENGASTGYHNIYFKELFELTLFADGTPFGIKED